MFILKTAISDLILNIQTVLLSNVSSMENIVRLEHLLFIQTVDLKIVNLSELTYLLDNIFMIVNFLD